MVKKVKKVRRDYREDLEKAARQMILVRRVDTLIWLILRTIMRTVKVKHAGIFLYDKERDEYVVKISKGMRGVKIPAGFAKLKSDSHLIRYFTDKRFSLFDQNFLLYDRINYYLRYNTQKGMGELADFLGGLRELLNLYGAKACIPGFFRNSLIGILFLGGKRERGGFSPEELGFLSVLASDVVMAIQNAWLFEDLSRQLDANKKLFLSTVSALAGAIEAKDSYTSGHTERVVDYSLAIAQHLKNSSRDDRHELLANLRIAALLHDIGKIGIPEAILNKQSPLDDNEREYIFKHPLVGISILNPIKEFKDVMLGVKYHHERYDGKGYPSGLEGEKIPLIAAIIAVADSYDAMISDRPYRKALSRESAIEEIRKNSGKQFNPAIVAAFLDACDDGKI